MPAGRGVSRQQPAPFWDIEFVKRLGGDPAETAARLVAGISDEQRRTWAHGAAADWVMESFALARDRAYGTLPAAGSDGCTRSREPMLTARQRDVASQLSKAGTRLALLLNRAMAAAQGVGR